MVDKEDVHQEGTLIPNWTAASRHSSIPHWSIFLVAFNCSQQVSKQTHHIRVNNEAHSDILWLHTYLEGRNGASLLSVAGEQTPNELFASDASGTWGCGAHWGVQLAWDSILAMKGRNIATQKLLLIIIAAAVWGSQWSGQCIRCQCDNQAQGGSPGLKVMQG